MAIPLSDSEIARRRAQSANDKSIQSLANNSAYQTALSNSSPTAAQFGAQNGGQNNAPTAEQFAKMNSGATTLGNLQTKAQASSSPVDRFGGNQVVGDQGQVNVGQNGYTDNRQLPKRTPATQTVGGLTSTPPLSFGGNVAKPTVDSSGNQIVNFDAAKNSFGSTPSSPVTANTPVPTASNTLGVQTPTSGSQTPPSTTTTPPKAPEAQLQDMSITSQTGQNQTTAPQNTASPTTPGGDTFDNQIAQGQGMQNMSDQVALADRNAQDELLRNKFLSAIGDTTLSDTAKQQGKDLGSMSFQELQNYAALNGIELNDKVKKQLEADKTAAIDNIKWGENQELAYNDLARKQLERSTNRALDEREQYNLSQDVKNRALMGSFGVQDVASNGAVLQAQDAGQKIKEDLVAEYGDKLTPLSLQAQDTIHRYNTAIQQIETQSSTILQNKYAEIVQKISDLRDQGVKTKSDYRKALLGDMKDYANLYNEVSTKKLDYYTKLNQDLFTNQLALRKQQQTEDTDMMSNMGIMIKNGVPLIDQNGNTVPTLDGMKFTSDVDQKLTQNSGYIYQNGQPLLDQKGNPIATFDRSKFITTENRLNNQFSANYNLDVNKTNFSQMMDKLNYQSAQDKLWSENTGKFYSGGEPVLGADGQPITTLQAQKTLQDMQTSSMNSTKTLIDAGVLPSSAMNKYLSPEDVISNSTYVTRGSGGQGVVKDLGNAVATALKGSPFGDNCVQFARSIIPDMPSGLYTLADKVNALLKGPGKLDIPEPGAVLVMSTGQPAGHVAVVTGVDHQSGKIYLAEANWKAGQTGTREMNINDPRIQGYWKSNNVQSGGGSSSASALKGVDKSLIPVVSGIRSEFDQQTAVKDFNALKTTHDFINKIPNNTQSPTDNQALIYAFAKAMDPSSSVKEGEYETVAKYAQSFAAKTGFDMQRVFENKNFLTEDAVKKIKDTINQKYDTQKDVYNNARNEYIRIINETAGKTGVGEKLLQNYDASGATTSSQNTPAPIPGLNDLFSKFNR